MKTTILLISTLILLALSSCNQGRSDVNSSTFLITDYGAVADGTTLNTSAIQAAIDACATSGGGTVVFPSGKFLTGTLVLKSNVEIHLKRNATLLGSIHQTDYPAQPMPKYRALRDEGGFNALIYAEGLENIAISGNGTIDGQGHLQRSRDDIPEGQKDDRPKIIMFISCQNITVKDVHLQSSGFWMQHYLDCEDVNITGISVYNHSNHDNDGIDIDGCRRVIVSDCSFDSTDDAITFKSTGKAMCEDVVITNCIASSFTNAIKMGTETTGGFKNISISNCVIKPSRHSGKRIYDDNEPESGYSGITLLIVDSGVMDGVNINNITIEGTQAPIHMRLGNRARKHFAEAPEPPVGKMQNISISNIVVHGAGTWTSSIEGMLGYPIKNISLNNIQLMGVGAITEGNYLTFVKEDDTGYPEPHNAPLPACGLYLRHVEGITIDNIVIGVENKDERTPIWAEDVSNVIISNTRLIGDIQSKWFVIGKDISNYSIEKPLGWAKRNKYLQFK